MILSDEFYIVMKLLNVFVSLIIMKKYLIKFVWDIDKFFFRNLLMLYLFF